MELKALQKWHGAGNDFIIDVTDVAGGAAWTPAAARLACDRHVGVGADGLLVAVLEGDRVRMTLFNADGSRAEMSGNGIRCLAAAVRRSSRADRDEIVVDTDAGERTVRLSEGALCGHGDVDMGAVTVTIGIEGVWGVANVGNPHVVVADHVDWSDRQREDLAAEMVARHGAANVEFATVEGPSRVRIVVIERGVGWTQACGTGSVATAAVLRATGDVGDDVVIANPGGDLSVHLDGASASLGGPFAFVADIAWELP